MIAGLGVSNHIDAHDSIMSTVENVLRNGGCMMADMGKKANTVDLGRAFAEAI